ncbi:MAG TPA: tetratricopeptide repeat protein [Drouetiella sp.]
MNRTFSITLFTVAISVMTQSKVSGQVSQYGSNQQLALSTPAAVPNGLQSLRAEAFLLYSASQYAVAANAYARLIQLGSTEASDRYWLGESLYHANDLPRAAAAFEQAIQLDSKYEQSYAKLAETYIALHQKDKARQVCDSGLRMVADPYRRQQLESLQRVATFQERKPVRNREGASRKLPMES